MVTQLPCQYGSADGEKGQQHCGKRRNTCCFGTVKNHSRQTGGEDARPSSSSGRTPTITSGTPMHCQPTWGPLPRALRTRHRHLAYEVKETRLEITKSSHSNAEIVSTS